MLLLPASWPSILHGTHIKFRFVPWHVITMDVLYLEELEFSVRVLEHKIGEYYMQKYCIRLSTSRSDSRKYFKRFRLQAVSIFISTFVKVWMSVTLMTRLRVSFQITTPARRRKWNSVHTVHFWNTSQQNFPVTISTNSHWKGSELSLEFYEKDLATFEQFTC